MIFDEDSFDDSHNFRGNVMKVSLYFDMLTHFTSIAVRDRIEKNKIIWATKIIYSKDPYDNDILLPKLKSMTDIENYYWLCFSITPASQGTSFASIDSTLGSKLQFGVQFCKQTIEKYLLKFSNVEGHIIEYMDSCNNLNRHDLFFSKPKWYKNNKYYIEREFRYIFYDKSRKDHLEIGIGDTQTKIGTLVKLGDKVEDDEYSGNVCRKIDGHLLLTNRFSNEPYDRFNPYKHQPNYQDFFSLN